MSIKRCTCGSNPIFTHQYQRKCKAGFWYDDNTYWINCPRCNNRTKVCDTKRKAVRQWNRYIKFSKEFYNS